VVANSEFFFLQISIVNIMQFPSGGSRSIVNKIMEFQWNVPKFGCNEVVSELNNDRSLLATVLRLCFYRKFQIDHRSSHSTVVTIYISRQVEIFDIIKKGFKYFKLTFSAIHSFIHLQKRVLRNILLLDLNSQFFFQHNNKKTIIHS
jgi:hypothetical protein